MSRVEQIGRATLYLGDCRDILQTLPRFDVVVTDPPYAISQACNGTINAGRNKGSYSAGFEDTPEYLGALVRDAIRPSLELCGRGVITPGRTNLWLYPEPEEVGAFYQPAAVGMTRWGRATWQPILFYGRDPYIGKTIHTLHYTLTEAPEKNGHPCPKPIKAWTWLTARATLPSDIIFDPLMGSGTTGVSCAALDRDFIGCEINPAYFDIACKRIEDAQRQGSLFEEAAA